jgi:hypothetical protein
MKNYPISPPKKKPPLVRIGGIKATPPRNIVKSRRLGGGRGASA